MLGSLFSQSFWKPNLTSKHACCDSQSRVFLRLAAEAAEPGRGGGALGASAPSLFVPGEKMAFFGNESALFSWNISAVLAKLKCPFWSVPPHFRGASAAYV